MALSVTKRYRYNITSFFEWVWIGGFTRKPFSFVKKWKVSSLAHDRKLDEAYINIVDCWTSFTIVGFHLLIMAWNLSSLVSLSLLINMKPNNFPTCTPNEHLVRVQALVVPTNRSQDFFKILTVVLLVWHLYYHVINVYPKILPYSFCKHNIQWYLVSETYFLEAKKNYFVVIITSIGHECSLGCV